MYLGSFSSLIVLDDDRPKEARHVRVLRPAFDTAGLVRFRHVLASCRNVAEKSSAVNETVPRFANAYKTQV